LADDKIIQLGVSDAGPPTPTRTLITSRADLIHRLRQMASPDWGGSSGDRMTLATTAAEVLEMYGQSADETQEKLSAIHTKLNALLGR
jgi:hypothetical protein